MSSPCNPNVSEAGGLSERDAEALLQQLSNRAKLRAQTSGKSIQDSLKEIAGEIKAEQDTMKKIWERNALLDTSARLNMKNFARRFQTFGEGLRALLEGSVKVREGGRNSVDYQTKANHGKYFGMLVSRLEDAGVLRDFKKSTPELVQDIYREMAAMKPGQPAKAVTKNEAAFKIAQVVDSVTGEMVSRQNRAGAYITRMPGYIIRQTHDTRAIRSVGGMGNTPETMEQSYKNWSEFTKPLLDEEKTFKGTDPNKFLRNIHEALYTGVHGEGHNEYEAMQPGRFGSLGAKASKERILHFKDADSAYKYNQAFGIHNFKEAILHDIHSRSRSISIMENMGPRFEANFEQVKRELAEEARALPDAAKHVDSMKDWRLSAAFNEISGKNEFTANPKLSGFTRFLKINAQISKMGAVLLSKMPVDFAAVSAEMRHQGMHGLQALGNGLANMVHTSNESKRMARSMSVGMEAMIGNTLSRFEEHSTVSGWSHTLQKWFYSMTGLPRWNDAFRSSAATVMAHELGEHAHMQHEELPTQLQTMLKQYDITPDRWNVLRATAYEHRGSQFITPDMVEQIPDEHIKSLVTREGLKATDTNVQRMRDKLETSLRTYFADRADIAVPTPGAAERKYMTFNTQAGTPIGEALRLMMMFKSFPITMMRKIAGTQMYGNGADSFKQWALNDHRGKFNMAMYMATMTAAGYVSLTLHDLEKGRAPRPLMVDGNIDWDTYRESAAMGGSLGLISESLFGEFDHNYRSYLQYAAGPTLGQLDDIFQVKQSAMEGKDVKWPATKLLLGNAPFANLFYIKPILDYFILWNLQEMMSPGSLERMESRVETEHHQQFMIRPSDVTDKNR